MCFVAHFKRRHRRRRRRRRRRRHRRRVFFVSPFLTEKLFIRWKVTKMSFGIFLFLILLSF